MKVSISRPRVYLIDFETAVQFPAECPLTDRVSVGCPFTVAEKYARPHAPEFASGKGYNPFKLDVWQLGYSFSDFKIWRCIIFYSLRLLQTSQSTIPTTDEVVVSMTNIDPVQRLDAKEAKDRLGTIFYSMAPESLLTKLDNERHGVPF